MIFYRIDYYISLLITCTIISFTRFEGLLIFFVYFICYCINQDYSSAVGNLCFFFFVSFFTIRRYPNWKKFVVPNKLNRNDAFGFQPFHYFLYCRNIICLRAIHVMLFCWLTGIFCGFILLYKSVPLAVFVFTYFLFVINIRSRDLLRFAIPMISISILIGLDFFLSSRKVRNIIKFLFPFFYYVELIYCGSQIGTKQISLQIWTRLTNQNLI